MSEFQRRLEANIRESLRFAVGEVQDDAVAHMVAGVNAVLNHPCAPAPEKHVAVTEAAKRYLEAIDSDPENDIWDTWDGKPAEGALKTASDASWADHGQKIEARLSELRAALTTKEGRDNG